MLQHSRLTGIALLIALAAIYWTYQTYFNLPRMMFHAVPKGSVALLHTHHIAELRQQLQQADYSQDIQHIAAVQSTLSALQFADSALFYKTKGKAQSLLASVHLVKADQYDVLLIAPRSALGSLPLADYISQIEKTEKVTAKSRQFRGITIYTLSLPAEQKQFTLANDGKLVYISQSATLVDEAINTNHQFWDNNGFWKQVKIRSGSNQIAAVLYLNTAEFPQLTHLFFKDKSNPWFFDVNLYTQWVEIGMRLSAHYIQIEGQTHLENTEHPVLQILNEPAGDNNLGLLDFAPENTATLTHYRVASLSRFFSHNNTALMAAAFSQFGLSFLGNEWMYGVLEPTSADYSARSYIVLKVDHPDKAREALVQLSAGNVVQPVIKAIAASDTLSPSPDLFMEVNAQPLVAFLMGANVAKSFNAAGCWLVDSALVIAPTKDHLQLLKQQILSRRTLTQNNYFNIYRQQLPKKGNVFLFVQPDRMKQWLSAKANSSFAQNLPIHFDHYAHLTPYCIELQKSGGAVELKGIIGYQSKGTAPNTVSAATIAWNATLSASPARAPQIVQRDNGSAAVLVQDANYNLYLLDQNGSILWQRTIAGPILNDIHTIDFYRNSKQQLVFTTAEKLYLLDMDGKDVNSYPLKLPTAAQAGVAVVWGDNGEQIQFYIPCAGDKIYGYDFSGRPLPMWSPRAGMVNIGTPILPLYENHIPYLFTFSRRGTVNILRISGSLVKQITMDGALLSVPTTTNWQGKPQVVATSQKGTTFFIAADGTVTQQSFLKGNKMLDFTTANFIGSPDLKEAVALGGDGKIYLHNYEATINTTALPTAGAPKLFEVKGQEKNLAQLGLFYDTEKKIYLLDKYQKPLSGFPLKATTPFAVGDLFHSGSTVVVAGGIDKNVFAYIVR